jgi:hypothetical protein
VTIAVGFHTSGGIVLCADSQETVAEYIKRHHVKIDLRPLNRITNEGSCALFSGAGNSDLIDHLIDKLWNAMKSKSDIDQMVAAIEDELLRIYERFVPLFPTGELDATFLVALWAPPDQLELIKISGPVVNRRIAGGSIGFGNILSTYIANRLLYPKVQLEEALAVAIYTVNEVKQHVRECGGETHAVIISYDGAVRWYSRQEIEAETRLVAGVDEIARRIAAVAMNRGWQGEDLRSVLDHYLQEVEGLRKSTEQK